MRDSVLHSGLGSASFSVQRERATRPAVLQREEGSPFLYPEDAGPDYRRRASRVTDASAGAQGRRAVVALGMAIF